MEDCKQTPLCQWHAAHGGRMVPFAGYLLPVQYETGVIAEHETTRGAAGLFDASHMGELILSGPGAPALLQRLITADVGALPPGRMRYALMCAPSGGVLDDLIVGQLSGGRWLLVVNAANRAKDAAWIAAQAAERAASRAALGAPPDTVFEDRSDDYALIALQGPASAGLLAGLAGPASIPRRRYAFMETGRVAGVNCLVSRTGYTGEDGFELFCTPGDAARLWEALIAAGARPCGLGCRDTLRLEAGMPLYGHEMDETVNPFEAGLGGAVALDKPGGFIGSEALARSLPPARRRVGLRVTGRGIVRERETVYADGRAVGFTTSGTFCPHLKQAVAMAIVDAAFARPGQAVEADVRGRRVPAEVCEIPFYRRTRMSVSANTLE